LKHRKDVSRGGKGEEKNQLRQNKHEEPTDRRKVHLQAQSRVRAAMRKDQRKSSSRAKKVDSLVGGRKSPILTPSGGMVVKTKG